jgi:hypothetical protein
MSTASPLLASYFVNSPSIMSFLSASTFAPGETQRVIASSLVGVEEPSIRSEIATTGSATEPKAPPTIFEKAVHSEGGSTDTRIVGDCGDRATADGGSAREQSSSFNALPVQRRIDPTSDAGNPQYSDETGTEFPAGGDMPAARPASIRAADIGLATQVPVDRDGFIFEDSDVRYISRAELEELPSEQLRIARHEILARRGRFFKDAGLSVHFSTFSWYQPSVWHVRLNAIEQANINLMWSIETASYRTHGPEIAQQKTKIDPSRRKPAYAPRSYRGLCGVQDSSLCYTLP